MSLWEDYNHEYSDEEEEYSQEVICDYCGKQAKYVDSKVIYRKSYGMVYLCKCVKDWAYVGVHKGTDRPLGGLADKELREWKKKAHDAFDPLWKSGRYSRREAYKWLSEALGIEEGKCHIGMFDIQQCKNVVRVTGY